MAGSGGYVQGFGSKAVGHFSFDGWLLTPGYQEVLPLGSLFNLKEQLACEYLQLYHFSAL